jgi:Zn-dependent protease with chaperone function
VRFRRHQEAAQASTRQLLIAFALVLLGVVLAANGVLALIYRLTFPFTAGYPTLFFTTNTAVVLLFVLGGCWFEGLRLREGGPHVARLAGARELRASGHGPSERQERRFAHVVAEMALASRMSPPPQAWVLARDDAINAFAAGWGKDDAVVVVTRGALERLTREELQGVVAHEFSHLAHGDTRLHMRLLGLVWGLEMVFTLGRSLSASDDQGRRSLGLLFGVGLMVVGWVGWAGGRLLQAAVSRQREYLADASAVQYTRIVHGIGGALRKIAHQAKHRADGLRSPQASALAHFYLHTPGRHFDGWWATHPPIAERLRRLYGEPVELLPDDPQPAPAPDEDLPLLALAPAGGARARAAEPEAARHDALQNPALTGTRQQERDAGARLALRQGPGEVRAALLAGLVGDDESAAARWQALTRPRPHAPAVRAELRALSAPTRLTTLRELALRLPASDRPALRRDARQLARTNLERLRRVVLLAPWRRAPRAAAPLADLGDAAAAATALLAGCFDGAGTPASAAWAAQVWQVLGTTPPAARRLLAARRLRRLAPMQRPLLVRAWVGAADEALRRQPAVVEALLLGCALLDTPAPPALEAQARVS